MNLTELDELKTRLDALQPLPRAALHNLHDELVVRWTYNSNAIEGNTLTLMETKSCWKASPSVASCCANTLRPSTTAMRFYMSKMSLDYPALDTAHVEGDEQPFLDLIAACVKEGFAPYWHILGINPPT